MHQKKDTEVTESIYVVQSLVALLIWKIYDTFILVFHIIVKEKSG